MNATDVGGKLAGHSDLNMGLAVPGMFADDAKGGESADAGNEARGDKFRASANHFLRFSRERRGSTILGRLN